MATLVAMATRCCCCQRTTWSQSACRAELLCSLAWSSSARRAAPPRLCEPRLCEGGPVPASRPPDSVTPQPWPVPVNELPPAPQRQLASAPSCSADNVDGQQWAGGKCSNNRQLTNSWRPQPVSLLSIATAYQLTTTTRRPVTRMNARFDLLNSQEANREQREKLPKK